MGTRSIGRGLAKVEYDNVLVAYAAKAGTIASDGSGDNSPFAEALSRYLVKPGLEVQFVFRNVSRDVHTMTQGSQQPYTYGSLGPDHIYFVSSEGSTPPKSDRAESSPVPELVKTSQHRAEKVNSPESVEDLKGLELPKGYEQNRPAFREAREKAKKEIEQLDAGVSGFLAPRLRARFVLDKLKRPRGRSSGHYEIELSIIDAPPWTREVVYKLHPELVEPFRHATNRGKGFVELIVSYGDFKVRADMRDTLSGSKPKKEVAIARSLFEALLETHGEEEEPSIVQALEDIKDN